MKLLLFQLSDRIETAIAFVDDNITDPQRMKLVEDLREMAGPSEITNEVQITSTAGNIPLDELIQMNMLYLDTIPTEFDE